MASVSDEFIAKNIWPGSGAATPVNLLSPTRGSPIAVKVFTESLSKSRSAIDAENKIRAMYMDKATFKSLTDEMISQTDYEINHIFTHPVACISGERGKALIAAAKTEMDAERVSRIVRNAGVYSVSVMDTVGCLITKIASESSQSSPPEALLPGVKELASGVNGSVFSVGLRNGKGKGNSNVGVIAVKSPLGSNPEATIRELAHECFIGVEALNSLRAEIPNFMYTYGVLTCAMRGGGGGGRGGLERWCSATAPRAQTIFTAVELIEGPTVRKIMSNHTENWSSSATVAASFLPILYQVTLSIAVAHSKFRFTHYDLHIANVIWRELPPPSSSKLDNIIVYAANDTAFGKKWRSVSIRATHAATIIDYGMSTIEKDGRVFSHASSVPMLDIGVARGISNPAADILRFIGTAILSLYPYQAEFLLPLYRVFDDGVVTVEEMVASAREASQTYFFIPPRFNNLGENAFSLFGFADLIRAIMLYMGIVGPIVTDRLDDVAEKYRRGADRVYSEKIIGAINPRK